MHDDRAAFEHAELAIAACINQRGDFRVRVDVHKAAGELHAFADINRERVIFCACVTKLEQFLEHHRYLHTVGRGERVELEWVSAAREVFLFARACGRAVDAGKAATILAVIGPNLGRFVSGIGHVVCLLLESSICCFAKWGIAVTSARVGRVRFALGAETGALAREAIALEICIPKGYLSAYALGRTQDSPLARNP